MAKFLFVSSTGESAAMAVELKRQGHKVRLFVEDRTKSRIYDGLVDKANGPLPTRDEIMIVDYCGYGMMIDSYRARGQSVIGPGKALEAIEKDPFVGLPALQGLGLKMPPMQTFTNVDAAVAFLKINPGKWYWYSNEYGETCLSSQMMTRLLLTEKPNKIILCQEIKDAYKFTLGGWFDGTRFVPPFFSSVGGYDCGIAWTYEQERPRLYVKILQLMERLLTKNKHVGFVNTHLLISPEGDVYVTCAEFAFPYMKMDLLQFLSFGNVGNELVAFAARGLGNFSYKPEYGVGVKLSGAADVPVDTAILTHMSQVILKDVYLEAPALPSSCGECIAIVGGHSDFVWDIFNNAKELCEELEIIGKEYPKTTCEEQRIAVRDRLEQFLFDTPFIKAAESKLPDIPVDLSSPAPPSSSGGGGTVTGGNQPNSMINLQHVPPDDGTAPEF